MAFSRPTLQQIIDRIAADFVSKITGSLTLALRSVLLIMARAYAGAVHSLYGYLDNQSKELFATTATADADGGKLDTIGLEYALPRNAAVAAFGTIACTGTPATVIPAGSALNSTAGNRYTTDAIATLDGAGNTTVTVTCDTAGVAGNDSAGITLTFESPIVGLTSTATVDANGLVGGADVEIDDDYRARILARKQLAPHGGAKHDLINWMLEVDGVTRAWAYPLYQGAGTVALHFVLDAQLPITPTASQVTSMVSYLTEHTGSEGQVWGVAVTMLPGMFVGPPVLKNIDMNIKIKPNTAAVQAAVTTAIDDYLYQYGVPDGVIYLSQLGQAIAASADLTVHQVTIPATDVTLLYNELAVRGIITWSTY